MKEIDYNDIDKECVGLVKFFNANGMETEFSCAGHSPGSRRKFYIMFSKKVSDKTMIKFISKFPIIMGCFMKWFRVVETNKQPQCNWMYLVTDNPVKINQEYAKTDLETFCRWSKENEGSEEEIITKKSRR